MTENTTTTTEVRVNIYMTLTAEQFAQFADTADLLSSIDARLNEVYDADGNPVEPRVLGIEVDIDEEV